MGKISKIILLSLLLVSILSLPVTLGCNSDDAATSEELSQLELEQILMDAINATNTIDSYQMTMDMDMFMKMEGGGDEGTMDIDATAEGAFDQKNMEMYMVMEMYMAIDMGGMRETMDDIVMDMYLVGDYLYMKMSIPEMGEEWMKMPATEENMASMDMNMFDQQMAQLESLVELKFLRYESVHGSECYVIEGVPDIGAAMELLEGQGLANTGFSWEDIDVVSDMFDELKYTCWIDKETKYMKKMTAYMLMEMSGDDFEDLSGESGSMTMDMNMDMEMYDQNEPVNIVLPDEAENAMEMGDLMF